MTSETTTEGHKEAVLKALVTYFGDKNVYDVNRLSRDEKNSSTVYEKIANILYKTLGDYRPYVEYKGNPFYPGDLVFYFNPKPGKDKSQMILIEKAENLAAFRREAAAARGESDWQDKQTLYTSGKPGKMIKKIIPTLSQQDCADFAVWWKNTIDKPETPLVIKTGDKPEDFARVYTSPHIVGFDTSFDTGIKCLKGSCMRHNSFAQGEGGITHPASIYGSGDFFIAWTEDSEGKIGSRCVVSKDMRPSFIYSAADHASKLLREWLDSNGAKNIPGDNDWEGKKVLKVKRSGYSDHYITPYIDGFSSLIDQGDHFTIYEESDPDDMVSYVNCSTTSGYNSLTEVVKNYCDDCEEYTSIELTSVRGGNCVCESCLENYTHTEDAGYVPNEEAVIIHYRIEWSNKTRLIAVSTDYNYVETFDEESWRASDCVQCPKTGEYYPRHLIGEEYYMTANDEEIIHLDDTVIFGDNYYNRENMPDNLEIVNPGEFNEYVREKQQETV